MGGRTRVYLWLKVKKCETCGLELLTNSGTMRWCEAHRAEATRTRERLYRRKRKRLARVAKGAK